MTVCHFCYFHKKLLNVVKISCSNRNGYQGNVRDDTGDDSYGKLTRKAVLKRITAMRAILTRAMTVATMMMTVFGTSVVQIVHVFADEKCPSVDN